MYCNPAPALDTSCAVSNLPARRLAEPSVADQHSADVITALSLVRSGEREGGKTVRGRGRGREVKEGEGDKWTEREGKRGKE